jgi:4-carboxymuconolactone decarboxylase
VPTRELLTFAMLAAAASRSSPGTSPRTQRRHRRARLIEAITQLIPFIGYPRTLSALRVVNEVRPARAERKDTPWRALG